MTKRKKKESRKKLVESYKGIPINEAKDLGVPLLAIDEMGDYQHVRIDPCGRLLLVCPKCEKEWKK